MNNSKKKFKFRGKQILLFGLVALVITAGYYRWTIEQQELAAAIPTASDTLPANADGGEGQENSQNPENSGNTESGTAGSSEEMSKLRRDRDAARGQSVDEWKKITQNSETSQEGKKDAEKKIAQATDNADKERKIETQVKAKGFEDCLAYVDESGVTVTVYGGDIDGSKVAQIKDIIVTETGVPVRNIKINAM